MKVEQMAAEMKDLGQKFEKVLEENKKLSEKLANAPFAVGNRSDSVEAKAMSYFHAKDAAALAHVNTGSRAFQNVPAEIKAAVRQLKSDIDVARLMHTMYNGGSQDFGAVQPGLSKSAFVKEVVIPRIKAFGTNVAGEGQEWVNEITSSSYIDEFELPRMFTGLFTEVPMPSNPFNYPVRKGQNKARIQQQGPGNSVASRSFGTDKIVMDATKLVEFYELPEELNEDSAPEILAAARRDVVEAQERAWESGGINGDDSVTHQDADTAAGGADLADKAWKGLRKIALDNSANGVVTDFGGNAPTVANMRAMRKSMGKYGTMETMLAWVVSPKTYIDLIDIDEVTTVEKFGQQATILRGALAALDGIPIIKSEFARSDLSATGVNTAPADALSSILLVNTSRFFYGRRRAIQVAAQKNPVLANDDWQLASMSRYDFQGVSQDATETSVSIGVNVL